MKETTKATNPTNVVEVLCIQINTQPTNKLKIISWNAFSKQNANRIRARFLHILLISNWESQSEMKSPNWRAATSFYIIDRHHKWLKPKIFYFSFHLNWNWLHLLPCLHIWLLDKCDTTPELRYEHLAILVFAMLVTNTNIQFI